MKSILYRNPIWVNPHTHGLRHRSIWSIHPAAHITTDATYIIPVGAGAISAATEMMQAPESMMEAGTEMGHAAMEMMYATAGMMHAAKFVLHTARAMIAPITVVMYAAVEMAQNAAPEIQGPGWRPGPSACFPATDV